AAALAVARDRIGHRQRAGGERRRRRKAGHFEDLLLVERLALEQRRDQRIEFPAVFAQQAQRLVVALADDALYLCVDDARGLVAERLFAAEPGRVSEIRVLA